MPKVWRHDELLGASLPGANRSICDSFTTATSSKALNSSLTLNSSSSNGPVTSPFFFFFFFFSNTHQGEMMKNKTMHTQYTTHFTWDDAGAMTIPRVQGRRLVACNNGLRFHRWIAHCIVFLSPLFPCISSAHVYLVSLQRTFQSEFIRWFFFSLLILLLFGSNNNTHKSRVCVDWELFDVCLTIAHLSSQCHRQQRKEPE